MYATYNRTLFSRFVWKVSHAAYFPSIVKNFQSNPCRELVPNGQLVYLGNSFAKKEKKLINSSTYRCPCSHTRISNSFLDPPDQSHLVPGILLPHLWASNLPSPSNMHMDCAVCLSLWFYPAENDRQNKGKLCSIIFLWVTLKTYLNS